jgi:hypothetical protein
LATSTGFHLDETELIAIPPNQVDFSLLSRRPKITRHDHVTEGTQMKVRRFLAAPAGS